MPQAPPADYNLYVYSEDNQILRQPTNAGTKDELVLVTVHDMPGMYRVQVRGATSSSYHARSYKLEVSLLSTSDLAVQGIEVTQVIQDLSNTVPLVVGKPAVARVYVGAGGTVQGPFSV